MTTVAVFEIRQLPCTRRTPALAVDSAPCIASHISSSTPWVPVLSTNSCTLNFVAHSGLVANLWHRW